MEYFQELHANYLIIKLIIYVQIIVLFNKTRGNITKAQKNYNKYLKIVKKELFQILI